MARKSVGYVKLQWTCPRCGGKNPGPEKTCLSCGGPQPADVTFEQVSGEEIIQGEAAQPIAASAADIHCGFCGTRNPANTAVCSQCGADLKEGTRRESGQVIGAFRSEPVPQTNCPNCNQPNPANALRCANCGAPLASQKAAPAAVKPTRKLSPLIIILIVAAAAVLMGLCIWVITLLGKSESVTGTVEQVNWMTSVPVEALQPVTRQDWKESIPAGAPVGKCEYRFYGEQSEPAPVSTEVCGTPYTIDQGTGYGEVVQDCTYEVYEEYCEYTQDEWVEVDQVTLEGQDLQPVFPSPQIASGQRLGEIREKYTIQFATTEKEYLYTTQDESLFQQAQIGSRWTLKINAFGDIVSIEPAP